MEEDTPVFPPFEGLDMASDGSDYDDPDDDASNGDDEYDDILEYDDISNDLGPKVLQLFNQAAEAVDDTDRCDRFVQHLLENPEDAKQGYLVWGSDPRFAFGSTFEVINLPYSAEWGRFLQPSFLHAFLEIMWRRSVDIRPEETKRRLGILKTIIKSHPDAMFMQPSALCSAINGVPAEFLFQTAVAMMTACPDAAKFRQNFFDLSHELPLHTLIKRVYRDHDTDTTLQCTVIMRELCKAYPEAVFQSLADGFPVRTAGFHIAGSLSALADNPHYKVTLDALAVFYLEFLRGATKAYLAMSQDADINEVDRHILFVATELEDQIIKNHGGPAEKCTVAEPLRRLVASMPRLASSRDDNGDYPLSHAIVKLAPYADPRVVRTLRGNFEFDAAAEAGVKYVQQLIYSNPAGLTTPIFGTGRLPIHLAIEAKSASLKDIVAKNSTTASIPDPVTRLYPFMMAAVGDDSFSVNIIYDLLRLNPPDAVAHFQ